MVELREVDRNNYNDVIKLSVSDEQKNFVSSNIYSLAQAKALPECIPLAICNNEEVLVGFLMYCMDFDEKEYWIYRLMIDKNHQGKGYGKAALKCILSEIKKDKSHNKVYLSFAPENEAAKKMYEEFGFVSDNRMDGGEVVYCLHYGCQEK